MEVTPHLLEKLGHLGHLLLVLFAERLFAVEQADLALHRLLQARGVSFHAVPETQGGAVHAKAAQTSVSGVRGPNTVTLRNVAAM